MHSSGCMHEDSFSLFEGQVIIRVVVLLLTPSGNAARRLFPCVWVCPEWVLSWGLVPAPMKVHQRRVPHVSNY